MIPGEFDGWLVAARRISVAGDQPMRRAFGMDRRPFRFDGQRDAQVERPVRKIDVMTAQIGQAAAAKRPPIAPDERNIFGREWPGLGRAEPKIVEEIGWDRRRLFGPLLVAESASDPNMDLA